MNVNLVLGISLGLLFAYWLARQLAHQSAIMSKYRRLMHDLMTNPKYQVKGRFD